MAFFNDLSKKFSGLTEKTKDGVESMRVNGELRAVGNECEKLYTQYGKICYGLRGGENTQEEADAVAEKIDGLLKRVKELNAQKDLLNAVVRCPECGMAQPKGSRFCASCGTKLPEEAPKPEPAEPKPVVAEKKAEAQPKAAAAEQPAGTLAIGTRVVAKKAIPIYRLNEERKPVVAGRVPAGTVLEVTGTVNAKVVRVSVELPNGKKGKGMARVADLEE